MSKSKSPYYDIINEQIAKQGAIGTDPRHVEAYMRLEYGTLDHLSRAKFASETKIALQCIAAEGVEVAERCAQSYGL